MDILDLINYGILISGLTIALIGILFSFATRIFNTWFPNYFVILFLIIGFTSRLWHPAWMLFLPIPAYYLTAWAFTAKTKKGMLLKLPVYLYAVILFLIAGFTASLWHPMWIIFLCIPAYYWYVSLNKNNTQR